MLPLSGFEVVSLAINLPGPVAAAGLRDLGAQVTKIEPPDGDPLAAGCHQWYTDLHEQVTVLRVDLKATEGREQLFALLETADLLLTSSRPAALARLALDWRALHARFPKLCHVSIIGHRAPAENRPGHDLTYQASLGLVTPPEMPRALLADLGGAQEAVTKALALLLDRTRGNPPAAAQVSLADAAERLGRGLVYGLTTPAGLLGGRWPGYNLYEAANGWIAVAALEPHFANRLVRELQIDSLDRRKLADAFRQKSANDWEAWGAVRDLPIVAVKSTGN